MKHSILTLTVFTVFLLLATGCSSFNTQDSSNPESSANWAYRFVVWNGDMYRLSDEYVDEVSKEIGKVTKYSDIEGTYSGNFSNEYEKGTKYFSIKDVSTDEAIAIQEKNGKYRKALNEGKYGKK
ncbi:hypothetical protein [Lentibacillus sp. CBA3610]|uniref:hypothetical protein n=1 Tax=Lentibacillus sp. CBA3610 TaxID=2518176 RepID=UPI0015963CDE|nr:hypothetical protein [Lentibacillus sp. CBA3610]QKY70675.1 hypothetical protein Len3610_14705 [Lentibacillus sp. CBA3610]